MAAVRVRELDNRSLAAILTGLRLLQIDLKAGLELGSYLDDILTNHGEFGPITADEIDVLCERLNTSDILIRRGVIIQDMAI